MLEVAVNRLICCCRSLGLTVAFLAPSEGTRFRGVPAADFFLCCLLRGEKTHQSKVASVKSSTIGLRKRLVFKMTSQAAFVNSHYYSFCQNDHVLEDMVGLC